MLFRAMLVFYAMLGRDLRYATLAQTCNVNVVKCNQFSEN